MIVPALSLLRPLPAAVGAVAAAHTPLAAPLLPPAVAGPLDFHAVVFAPPLKIQTQHSFE